MENKIKTHLKSYNPVKFKVMRNILYIIALVLIIGWLLGAFVYSTGQLIHILLVLAILSIILGVIRNGV